MVIENCTIIVGIAFVGYHFNNSDKPLNMLFIVLYLYKLNIYLYFLHIL